jgi:hypothetical protein
MRGDITVGADDGEACRVLAEPLAQAALKVLDDLRPRVSRGVLAGAGAQVGDLDEAGSELGKVVTLAPVRYSAGSAPKPSTANQDPSVSSRRTACPRVFSTQG